MRRFIIVVSLLIATMMSTTGASAQTNAKPFVVPELTQWNGAEGTMALSGRVVVSNKKLTKTAQDLCREATSCSQSNKTRS